MIKGNKHWANTWTEIEDLGNGKFGATISVGHRVFFDKADGNKPKKHKLTDERPNKDYVLIQGAKCCVEVYPYYAKYYDVQHEEVRLYEERWVVQRLFKEPDTWRDIGTWNPVISVEEYPEPAGDVVKVTVTYDTDYGTLTVEYFQRDGNTLKHNVTFKNTSGSTETFRVLQKWAGIVGAKVNGKDFPTVEDTLRLAFHKADKSQKQFTISENLGSMVFNSDGTEKIEKCLQRPVRVEAHAQGMKADFIYSNWILVQDESLEIDPDTATLDDPTEDGYIATDGVDYARFAVAEFTIGFYQVGESLWYRGYVEWDISPIPDSATITKVEFRYTGITAPTTDHGYIYAMAFKPSVQSDDNAGNQVIYDDAGDGTAYLSDSALFPQIYVNDVGGASGPAWSTDPKSDVQSALPNDWFALGFKNSEVTLNDVTNIASTRDYMELPPTLYVEYTLAVAAGGAGGAAELLIAGLI